jgi:HlyD family secretion protein
MATHTPRRKWIWIGGALLALVVLLWGLARWRGPVMPAYEVAAGPLVQNVVATGRVAALSRVEVGSEISGLVLERRVMEGDRVEPGDVLVVLRAADLEARRDEARAALDALRQAERPDAQARLRQAQAELAQAEREATRRRELGAQQLVSREMVEQAQQAVVAARAAAEQARVAAAALSGGAREAQAVERLRAAEADLERAVIRATVAGTVLLRQVEPGDVVSPGQVLLELAREAPGEILLPLDEKNLARLAVGQSASCEADAWPGRRFNATVHHIAPSIDPARGTVDVRLRIDPAADFLREDMTVTASILTGQRPQALAIPNDALLDDELGRTQGRVLRVRSGTVEQVEVELGLRGLAMTEVVQGLAAGDQVLAAGSLAAELRPQSGSRVRVRTQAPPAVATPAPPKENGTPAALGN